MIADRRSFLRGAIAAAALYGAGCRRRPTVARAGLPSREEIWERELRMNALGPRYTANPVHRAFVDQLADELGRLGLPVREDRTPFTRWTARRSALAVRSASDANEERVEIASVYPYSSATAPEGVEGPLVYGGTVAEPRLDGELSGCILYLDAPAPSLPFGEWYADPQLYGRARSFPASVAHAAAQIVTAPDLSSFAEHGVRGVILGWTNVSEAQARDQYIPFNRPMQPIPGLWVGPGAAARLRSFAQANARARLTLEADLAPGTISTTIYAELPGASDELLIVNTHTDGPNAVEENGPIAVLALARRLASLERSQRRRSCLFLLASGHFVGPPLESTEGFLQDHPEILQRAVAALAVEHLGAKEWLDVPGKGYAATGEAELSLWFTRHAGLANLALEAARSGRDARGAIVHPRELSYFFGEGRPLARAGIPTLGFLPAPSYLLSGAPNGHIDKVDADLMYAQIELLSDVLDRLMAAPPGRLGA